MRRAVWALMVLSSLAAGCETAPHVQPIASNPASVEPKLLALQQEREQLLTTLGEFHDRIRDLGRCYTCEPGCKFTGTN